MYARGQRRGYVRCRWCRCHVVGGGQVATLQNGNGVVLQVQGPQVGFQVNIGLGGMTLALH